MRSYDNLLQDFYDREISSKLSTIDNEVPRSVKNLNLMQSKKSTSCTELETNLSEIGTPTLE